MRLLLTGILVCTIAFTALAQHDMSAMKTGPMKAIAVVYPVKGKAVHGVITFTQTDKGVKVVGHLEGLEPGNHGFHVHEFGDCSAPDFTSAGGHYNPGKMAHGGPDAAVRHEGDLGNIVANEKGIATLEWVDPMLRLSGPNSIVGRAVIIHTQADDLKSQPTGNAGAREGCGVIGIMK